MCTMIAQQVSVYGTGKPSVGWFSAVVHDRRANTFAMLALIDRAGRDRRPRGDTE